MTPEAATADPAVAQAAAEKAAQAHVEKLVALANEAEARLAKSKAQYDADLADAGTKRAAADGAGHSAQVLAARGKLILHGTPGGPFSILGEGLGELIVAAKDGAPERRGSVTIGGRVVEVTGWNDAMVKGRLPLDVAGPVILHLASGEHRVVQLSPSLAR